MKGAQQSSLKTVILLFCLMSITATFLACTTSPPEATEEAEPSITLSLSGSGGGSTILQQITQPFTASQNQLILDYLSGSGGSASKRGVAENILDVGILLSSDINAEEQDGIEILPLGDDPLAFVVHPNLPIDNLTSTQLQDIYKGRITNWQTVGGPDALIFVFTRNEDEASTVILRKSLFGEAAFAEESLTLTNAGDMRTAVTETPFSIGFMSYGDFVTRQLPAKVISVDGVAPSEYSEGRYPIPARTLAVVYNPNNLERLEPFLTYLQSDEAQKTLLNLGLSLPQ